QPPPPQKQPPPQNANKEEDVEGELGEEEDWFGNTSETPSEASYGEIQEGFKAPLEDRLQERTSSPETSLGSATPVGSSLELLGVENEALQEKASPKDPLVSVVSTLYGEGLHGKPLSSNLRRLLEAGSLKLDSEVVSRSGGESPISPVLTLSPSPSSHHAQQLSALARKLAAKPEQNERRSPNNSFMWNHDKWLQNSASCVLSPDSAIQKLKAAANAVLQDKTISRTEDTGRFESFTSSFSLQSASSTLAALSKKVSERSMSTGQDHQPQASSFLSLASMTSSAALLKEVAARAAGNLLAEKKEQLVPGETVQLPDRKPEKLTASQSLELLLIPSPKGRAAKCVNQVSEEEGGKPFQCPICGLVIKRKSYWKRHMVIHTGLKSHQCPLCPFRCARKDNLKSHMKVHQHQDRGETFQCQLCPFTSSRHFSLKLHMRCHQHFPRTEVKVKEEIMEAEVEGSLLNHSTIKKEGEAELLGAASKVQSSLLPQEIARIHAIGAQVAVKEEPKEEKTASAAVPFLTSTDRSKNSTKTKDSPDYSVNTPASLFAQDISVKMASDILMKLSAANQKESPSLQFIVKEEPKDDETAVASVLPQPSYAFKRGPTAAGPSVPEIPRKTSDVKANILNQDISVKVASEFLMKLSAESNKETILEAVRVKEEPMEIEIDNCSVPASSRHAVGFSTLSGREETERLPKVPEVLACPEKNLFNQDISVKMASELLFKLSEKVSKLNDQNKDGTVRSIKSPFFCEDQFRQSPFSPLPKDLLHNETGLHGKTS
uniref:Zinc finger protein 827 n=1 Tax=Latimeria chalumnae TaxID=7897 RepID=H3AL19_LATCH